jgi:hypothetical protein
VFFAHGGGQTAFVFMEAADVKEAANKHGFIAVAYNTTTDVSFVKEDLVGLVKEDCRSLGVAADDSRLYALGHSMGGGAVLNFTRDAALVGTFAAFAHSAGAYSAEPPGSSRALVPLYAMYGEYDVVPMKFGPLVAGDWRGSSGGYASVANSQDYWLQRLIGRTLAEEMATPTYIEGGGIMANRVPQNTPISLILKPTATANRYKTYTWERSGIPLLVWSQCYGRGHNPVPENIDRFWEDWFNKWQKGSQAGTLRYWKDGVGVGQYVVLTQ